MTYVREARASCVESACRRNCTHHLVPSLPLPPVQRGYAFLAPQTFQLDARTAVEAWLSSTCKDLPAASAGHLRDLTAGIR